MLLATLAFIVALLSAAFTGWYALETRRMRSDNKAFADEQLRQAKASSDAAERSATAAETSAKAAQESAEIASEGIQLSQRAYLGTSGIEFVSSVPSVNQALVVKLILKNSGNSPALNVRIAEKMDFLPDVRTVSPIYPENQQPGFDIGPGVEVVQEYKLPVPVTQEQVNAVANDSKRLYVFGWARYTDIFDKEHSTKWCYEYSRFTVTKNFNVVAAYHRMEQ